MKIGKNNILKVKSIEVFFSYSLKKKSIEAYISFRKKRIPWFPFSSIHSWKFK